MGHSSDMATDDRKARRYYGPLSRGAAYGGDGVFVRTTVKVDPSPGDDTTSIVPPWAQTNSDRLGSMRRSRSSGLRSPLQRATLGYNSSPVFFFQAEDGI